jgi:hypothetical protein
MDVMALMDAGRRYEGAQLSPRVCVTVDLLDTIVVDLRVPPGADLACVDPADVCHRLGVE